MRKKVSKRGECVTTNEDVSMNTYEMPPFNILIDLPQELRIDKSPTHRHTHTYMSSLSPLFPSFLSVCLPFGGYPWGAYILYISSQCGQTHTHHPSSTTKKQQVNLFPFRPAHPLPHIIPPVYFTRLSLLASVHFLRLSSSSSGSFTSFPFLFTLYPLPFTLYPLPFFLFILAFSFPFR